jgi:hypothetical protein
VNNAAMNLRMQMSPSIPMAIAFGYVPEEELLNQMIVL